MIRKADPSDVMAIAAFLEQHIESSMFLLGNLELHGIGNTDHPHGTTYFLRETGDGITGVFGVANGGFLMCQIPGLTATEAQTYAHLLRGYTLRGMTGQADQVALVIDALPADDWALNRIDPLYALDLGDLDQTDAQIRPPTDADRSLLIDWFTSYFADTGMSAAGIGDVSARAESAIEQGTLRLLIENDAPVAMSDINARAGQAVQIGGVYTPPDQRGKSYAGRLITAQLAELRAQGITRAILFAASPKAAKLYERIGFQFAGDYRVAMLSAPQTLGAAT